MASKALVRFDPAPSRLLRTCARPLTMVTANDSARARPDRTAHCVPLQRPRTFHPVTTSLASSHVLESIAPAHANWRMEGYLSLCWDSAAVLVPSATLQGLTHGKPVSTVY